MLNNDRILDLLARFQGSDPHTNQRLQDFAHSLMDCNKPLDETALDVIKKMAALQKISMIKELRNRTRCGLKEAKESIERALVTHLEAELADAKSRVADHNKNVRSDYIPSDQHDFTPF